MKLLTLLPIMKSQYPYIGPINVHLRCTKYTHTLIYIKNTQSKAKIVQFNVQKYALPHTLLERAVGKEI